MPQAFDSFHRSTCTHQNNRIENKQFLTIQPDKERPVTAKMDENMDGMLVFDQQNDIVFMQLNTKMKQKLFDMAKQQELVGDDAVSCIDYARCILHFLKSH